MISVLVPTLTMEENHLRGVKRKRNYCEHCETEVSRPFL